MCYAITISILKASKRRAAYHGEVRLTFSVAADIVSGRFLNCFASPVLMPRFSASA